jgi:hypothetical protein
MNFGLYFNSLAGFDVTPGFPPVGIRAVFDRFESMRDFPPV